jgi:hypothetical protein
MSATKATTATKGLRVEISEDLHWRIKLQAMQSRTTLQVWVINALESYLAPSAFIAKAAHETHVVNVKPKGVKGKD